MCAERSLAVLLLFLLNAGGAFAQSTDAPRFEFGAHFASITIREPGNFPAPVSGDNSPRTETGVGGRFTFNLTDTIAAEAEMTFFPRRAESPVPVFGARTPGRITQGLFGVKAGRRFDKFGIYGKARPGFIRFGRAFRGTQAATNIFGSTIFVADNGGRTDPAVDVGGVLEFYPSRRIVTRFDAGDTIIRFRELTYRFQPPPPAGPVQPPVAAATLPGHTQHNFQFNAGIGIRF